MPKPPRSVLSGNLPPGIQPRGLTKLAAAEYVGCTTIRAFEDRVRRGLLPGPVPGTNTYDRNALDAAMNRLSGIVPARDAEGEADTVWREWERGQAAEEARRQARTARQLRGSLNPAHNRKR